MTDLLIDTDVALGVWHEGRPRDIDDGFAIVEAINSPRINLLGVTCVFGNGPIDEVYRVANDIVQLKGADVPVIKGASVAIDRDDDSNEAVRFMADLLSQRHLTIAAIGPLTNLGLLIQHHPEAVKNIDEVIVVAGRSKGADFYIGDTGPVNDFNFENDVTALERLMACGVPVVLMGFELTSQVCITQADLLTIGTHESPTASYFYENSLAWCEYRTTTFPEDSGFHPWDSATIAWILDKNMFVYEHRGHVVTRKPKRLECDTSFPGIRHTYCTGFAANGAQEFVQTIIRQVY